MLILRRKSGESIVIGENINVTVLDINEGSVRLAIDAPKSIPILRSELLQAVDVNRDAAGTERSQPRNLLKLLGRDAAPGEAEAADARPQAVRPGAAGQRLPRKIPTQPPSAPDPAAEPEQAQTDGPSGPQT